MVAILLIVTTYKNKPALLLLIMCNNFIWIEETDWCCHIVNCAIRSCARKNYNYYSDF